MSSPRQPDSTSETHRLFAEMKNFKLISPVIYYFRGTNDLQFFGHIAVGGITNEKTNRNMYLTYGVPSTDDKDNPVNLVKNDGYTSSPHIEKQMYGEYFQIKLPPCDAQDVQKAINNFLNLDRNKYSVIENNCANSVVGFLKDVRFLPQDEKFHVGLRPAEVALRICDMRLAMTALEKKDLEAKHPSSKAEKWDKLVKLINFDKDRLELELFRDQVDTKRRVKNVDVKKSHLASLSALSDQFSTTTGEVNYNKYFVAMLEAYHRIQDGTVTKSRTKKTLSNCIELFPEELLTTSKDKLNFIGEVKEFASSRYYDESKGVGIFKVKTVPPVILALRKALDAVSLPVALPAKKTYHYMAEIKSALSEGMANEKLESVRTACTDWSAKLSGLLKGLDDSKSYRASISETRNENSDSDLSSEQNTPRDEGFTRKRRGS